jgi:hypothetical protein
VLPAFVNAILRQQPYEPHSLDGRLLSGQVFLTYERASIFYSERQKPALGTPARPQLAEFVERACSTSTQPLARMLALTRWCSRVPLDFPRREHSTANGFYDNFAGFMWGGSEECVIGKGSPWPQELARVLAALAQTAGIPSRLVFLYREKPMALHVVAELWVDGGWALCDPCANRCYLWPHHGYASALDLQQHPRLIELAPEHGRCPYVDSGFFRTIALGEYAVTAEPAPRSELRPARIQDLPALQASARVFQERL